MKISVLIPTLGERLKEFTRLMDSINDQLFKDFEIIVVSQSNHDGVYSVLKGYPSLNINHISIAKKGLSYARNIGTSFANGEIIILSDDDCWYPDTAFARIENAFHVNIGANICLTQIYDKDNNAPYKDYPQKAFYISHIFQLLSKSSCEIAYRRLKVKENYFDDRFGLGSEFACGEEVDFLIRNYKRKTILYIPEITVYHTRKKVISDKQIVAKGALYRKHFNILICFMVLIKDLIIKKQNNFINFFIGYNKYPN